jgi:hypothetical protein
MLLAVVIFYLSGVFGDKHSLDAETRNALIITANGPAIWGGCVTRRQHRVGSWYFSRETVTVQGGYGVVFAIRVQVLIEDTRVAVQI